MLEKGGENQLDRSVRKEEVLQRVEEYRNILQTIKDGRLTGLLTSCIGSAY
jgi:hypothetical protein